MEKLIDLRIFLGDEVHFWSNVIAMKAECEVRNGYNHILMKLPNSPIF